MTFVTPLDYETATKKEYNITIQATDGQESTSHSVTINILDVDETSGNRAPEFSQTQSTVHVNENTKLVSYKTKVSVSDPDNDTLTYSIYGSDIHYFVIDKNTGVLTFKESPDYETSQRGYHLSIRVSDSKGGIAYHRLQVLVDDVAGDNNKPYFLGLIIITGHIIYKNL